MGLLLLLSSNNSYSVCCEGARYCFFSVLTVLLIGKSEPMLQDAGKYVILFFYPADFTFVCPSEIVAFSDRIEEFQEINTEVSSSCGGVALSIDRLALHSGVKVQTNILFIQLRYAQFLTVHSACLVFCALLSSAENLVLCIRLLGPAWTAYSPTSRGRSSRGRSAVWGR